MLQQALNATPSNQALLRTTGYVTDLEHNYKVVVRPAGGSATFNMFYISLHKANQLINQIKESGGETWLFKRIAKNEYLPMAAILNSV